MINIRNYTESDAEEGGRLIADTYTEFNLSFATPDNQALMLGPFRHAYSTDEQHRQAIVQILQSPVFLVAEVEGELAGVLRGRKERLASLFVRKDFHHQGIIGGSIRSRNEERKGFGDSGRCNVVRSSFFTVNWDTKNPPACAPVGVSMGMVSPSNR